MKDSGVEWLGEIPAHWQVVPLQRLTPPDRAIMYGIVLPGPDVGVGVPIVKGGDVKQVRLKLERLCRTTPEIELPFARARLLPNDIVYSIRGSIGEAELVPAELAGANITQDVARISPLPGVNFRWLIHVMRSTAIFSQLEQRSLGATIRGINIFDLKRARIPCPPVEEREAIAKFLDRALSELSGLRDEATVAISLLQERRAALISAAVTGKIDVRGLVERMRIALAEAVLQEGFGVETELVALKPRRLNLSLLRARLDLEPPPGSIVERARLVSLSLRPFDEDADFVLFATDGEASSAWDVMERRGHPIDCCADTEMAVERAVLEFRFRPVRGAKAGRTKQLKLSAPHGCTARYWSDDEREAGDACLDHWGLRQPA